MNKKCIVVLLLIMILFAGCTKDKGPSVSENPQSIELKNSELIKTEDDYIIFDISGSNEDFTKKSFSWSFAGEDSEKGNLLISYETLTPGKNLISDAKINDKTVEFTPAEDQGTGIAALTLNAGNHQKKVFVKFYDLSKPLVRINFDDGPSEFTDDIIETLNNAGVNATFFVTGKAYHDVIHEYIGAEIHPETLKKTAYWGNQIGNHTYSHPWQNEQDGELPEGQTKIWEQYSIDEVKEEVKRLDDLVSDLAGTVPEYYCTLYRLDYVHADKVGKILPNFKFTLETEDWKKDSTIKNIVDKMLTAKSGDIIVMHDVYQKTADALKEFLNSEFAKGFQFVTFSEYDKIFGFEADKAWSWKLGDENTIYADTSEELIEKVTEFYNNQDIPENMKKDIISKELSRIEKYIENADKKWSWTFNQNDFYADTPEELKEIVEKYCSDQVKSGNLTENDKKSCLSELELFIENNGEEPKIKYIINANMFGESQTMPFTAYTVEHLKEQIELFCEINTTFNRITEDEAQRILEKLENDIKNNLIY